MKKLIREKIKAKLQFLDQEERIEKSFNIMQLLFKLKEFKQAKTIAFFVGLKEEVETKPMIEEALIKGKRIVLPITDFKKHELIFAEINNLNELIESKYGLLEPLIEKKIKLNEIDLFIVPGIAFDLSGSRIGKGKGFYDKILKQVNKSIPIIALAFEFQVLKEIPIEEHDIKVNLIVTEKRVIKCKEKMH